MKDFDAVGNFHQKFGLPTVSVFSLRTPRPISAEVRDFRLKFLLEELEELVEGYGGKLTYTLEYPEPLPPQDLPQIADALVDLVYVALGCAHYHGFPWDALFNEVQRANMTKTRAAKDGSDSKRGSGFDVVKPQGWTPPNIGRILAMHGWVGPELPFKE